jgi:muconolactone D-isomerase
VGELFAVRMVVNLPVDLDPHHRATLLADERAYSQRWQRSGHWKHLWRCVGAYSNLSIFDVDDTDQLHRILWGLPMFAYLDIAITALTAHPSDIARPHVPPTGADTTIGKPS